MMKSPTNKTPWSGRWMNIASWVSPPWTGMRSKRVPPIFNSVRRSIDVRFEAAYVIQAEALAEEAFSKDPGGVEFALNFFVIVAPGIDAQARI